MTFKMRAIFVLRQWRLSVGKTSLVTMGATMNSDGDCDKMYIVVDFSQINIR